MEHSVCGEDLKFDRRAVSMRTYETGGDGVALVTFDLVEDSMNEYGNQRSDATKAATSPQRAQKSRQKETPILG